MNNRIKELRKNLRLTQEDFGSKIGLSRAEVSNIEIGRAPVRPATIPIICSVLGVNRTWLETGEGEMFVSEDTNILNRLAEEFNLSRSEEALIATFVQLPAQDRAAILRYVRTLADNLPNVDPDEEEAEQIKQDYLRQKRAAAASSATDGQSGGEKMA